MSEIPSQLERWSEKVSKLSTQAETAKAVYNQNRERHIEAKEQFSNIEQAQIIAQTIAQSIQEKIHNKIAGVVSQCLSTIFNEPYRFKILFERRRGRTEADLTFERRGYQVDPMGASGGGPVELSAFALRLSSMMLQRPKLRRILIMDEPFKSPSPHYRERVKQLIETLSKEMGVQFIMVTNIMELAAGDVINLED